MFSLFRRSSSSSSASSSAPTSPSLSYSSSPSSSSSASDWESIEPISPNGELPHLFVVERSLKAPVSSTLAPSPATSRLHQHSHEKHHELSRRPHCNRNDSVSSSSSIFSFPRAHTSTVCPRHGIVHSPDLALPERESRSTSSKSSTGACSEGSGRSIKCALRRMKIGDAYSRTA